MCKGYDKISKFYRKYPVWLFYWWNFHSSHRDDLREFRKTIVTEESVANKYDRQLSSKPLIEMGKMIDEYKTW